MVKVSHRLIAVGAVGLESHCILGTADERQSPIPLLSLPCSHVKLIILFSFSDQALMKFPQAFNPIALRMAKTPLSFGHSECIRIKRTEHYLDTVFYIDQNIVASFFILLL